MGINSYNNSSNGAALGNVLKIVSTLGDLGIIKTPQAKQAEAQTQLAQQEGANKQVAFDQAQEQYKENLKTDSPMARAMQERAFQSIDQHSSVDKSSAAGANKLKELVLGMNPNQLKEFNEKSNNATFIHDLMAQNAEIAKAKLNNDANYREKLLTTNAAKEKSDLAKRLPADKVLLVNESKNALKMLEDLDQTIENNKDYFGPVAGRTSTWNPYNETGNAISAQLKTTAQVTGKALEGGVLRKEDESKYAKMLSQIENPYETAKNKNQLAKRMVNNKIAADIKALADAGYDTSGLMDGMVASPDLPDAITGKKGQKKSSGSIPTAQAAQPARMSEEEFINKFLDAKAKRK